MRSYGRFFSGEDNPCPVGVGSSVAGIEFHLDTSLVVFNYHLRRIKAISLDKVSIVQAFKSSSGSGMYSVPRNGLNVWNGSEPLEPISGFAC